MSVGSRSRSLFPNPTSSSPEGKDPGYIFPQSPLPPSSLVSLYPSVSSVIPLSFSSGWLSPPSNHYDLLLHFLSPNFPLTSFTYILSPASLSSFPLDKSLSFLT